MTTADYLGADPCEGCYPDDPEQQVYCRNEGRCDERAVYDDRRALLEALKAGGVKIPLGWQVFIPEAQECS